MNKPAIVLTALLISISASAAFTQSLPQVRLAEKEKTESGNKLSDQVSVTYNYIHNLGNFGDTYEPGSGVMFNYGFHIPESYLVVLRTGYYTHKLREGADTGYSSFKVIPLHVGGRYYLYKDVFMPYFSFMNGLNFFMNSESVNGKEDESLIRYAFQLGFGFDVRFTRNFGINLNINYNNSFYDAGDIYAGQESAMTTGFEYSGGLSYFF